MAHRKKHEEHEEHENHERWLITYADMITLLMVLFIVLFSMSQVDLAKFAKLKASFASAFGGSSSSGPMDGSNGVLDAGSSPIPMAQAAQRALAAQQAQQAAQQAEQASLQQTKGALAAQLDKAGLPGAVSLTVEHRGLVVSIASDKVLFEPGEAALTSQGATIVDQLVGPLAGLPNALHIEGHTDDVPISGAFASNWELSTARATTVLRELQAHGIKPARLSATGYADQRPLASNATPAGRARNRRVEILVEAMTNTEGGS
jgi:chemotaxis protein MotB